MTKTQSKNAASKKRGQKARANKAKAPKLNAGERADALGRVYGKRLESDQVDPMIAKARKAGFESVYAVRKFIRDAGFGINPHVLRSYMEG